MKAAGTTARADRLNLAEFNSQRPAGSWFFESSEGRVRVLLPEDDLNPAGSPFSLSFGDYLWRKAERVLHDGGVL